ncbi:MAG: glycosyltransferase [Planctomycetota bacterium]|nr:glycosyltransferase [Planctomycetota bacterium]
MSGALPSFSQLGVDRVDTIEFAVSVVIPARNAQADLRRCLTNLNRSVGIDFELIVVDDASSDATSDVAAELGARVIRQDTRCGPALARNRGAAESLAELLVFVDADVLVRPDTLFALASRLQGGCDAVFGSYDLQPWSPNLVAQYKNLLHHFVHQQASREASTFWSGCGAIRARTFADVGGFSDAYRRPCIEDIELGVRLKKSGHRIELDPDIQVTHLKRWTLATLIRADVFDRALPWTQLILEQGTMPNDLNLTLSQRLCVILSASLVVFLIVASWYEPGLVVLPVIAGCSVLLVDHLGTKASFARNAERVVAVGLVGLFAIFAWRLPLVCTGLALALAGVLVLNHRLFRFFSRHRGLGFAIMSLPLQVLYYFYSGAAFGLGCAKFGIRRLGRIFHP